MERIILLSITILLFATVTKAQITKGSVYLGGSVGFSTKSEEINGSSTERKSTSFSINPAIGVAIKNNLIAGIDLNYLHSKSNNISTENNKVNTYGVGVFLRKYFPISNRFYAFGQTDLGYLSQTYDYFQSTGYTTSTYKQHSISANLYPGIAIHVFKSLYLEAAFNNLLQIEYSSTTIRLISSGTITKQKDFGIQSSLSSGNYLNIGVRFIIPKK